MKGLFMIFFIVRFMKELFIVRFMKDLFMVFFIVRFVKELFIVRFMRQLFIVRFMKEFQKDESRNLRDSKMIVSRAGVSAS